MDTDAPLSDWSPALGAALTTSVIRIRHRLGELPLFRDSGLEALLGQHPKDALQAYAPGTPGVSSWPAVLLGDVDGATMLEAVREHGMWLNVIRADENSAAMREVQTRLFAEIGEYVDDLLPDSPGSTVLISPAGATVPYHLDPEPNILWHVRGHKQIRIYPASNDEFVSRENREDLFAGVLREYAPFDSGFDSAALVQDLHPGEAIAWPQNSPHRVVSIEGLNVSLNTDFATARSRRRSRLYCANRFLGRRLHLPIGSTIERGAWANTKIAAYGIARRLGAVQPGKPAPIDAELELDPRTGRLERLDTIRPAAFA